MRRTAARHLAWAALSAGLAAGCGSNEPVPAPFAPTDPAGALFVPDHVVEVSIEMAAADWEALRRQTRTWYDVAAAENKACMVRPFIKPFTWFPGTITVDGVRRENVAIRKKGFIGSLVEDRPALKVHFDADDPEQTLYGLKRLTLNNSVQDPTWLRQCIAYEVFGKAGIPVPWCNFAHVTVNGRDLGLYVHLESTDRRFVRRYFERDEGELWEGEVSDFRADWITSFEKKGDVEDDDQTKVDRSSLSQVADAVAPQVPAAQIRARLEKLIDLDEFLRFWAVEKILEHWDGYANGANNFFIYRDPATSRFVFMPAGTDQITVPDPWETAKPPVSVYAKTVLSQRLYDSYETRQMYAETLAQMLDRAFPEDELLREVDRMQELVVPVLARSGADLEKQAKAVDDLRGWIRGRRPLLLEDLRNGPPEWHQALKQSICVDLAGTIEGSFGTSFGTNRGLDIFRTGAGVLTGSYRRRPLGISFVGASAGYDTNAQLDPWAVVSLAGAANDGTRYDVWIGVNPERFRAGAAGPFDGKFAWGGMGNWNPTTWQWTYLGGFVDGWLDLDQAGLTAGAPVSGRFQAKVIKW